MIVRDDFSHAFLWYRSEVRGCILKEEYLIRIPVLLKNV